PRSGDSSCKVDEGCPAGNPRPRAAWWRAGLAEGSPGEVTCNLSVSVRQPCEPEICCSAARFAIYRGKLDFRETPGARRQRRGGRTCPLIEQSFPQSNAIRKCWAKWPSA